MVRPSTPCRFWLEDPHHSPPPTFPFGSHPPTLTLSFWTNEGQIFKIKLYSDVDMKLVTAAIIRDGENIHVVRRAPGEKLAGFRELPGGKVEQSETLQDCLERELFEELKIATKVSDIVAVAAFKY